MGFRHYLYLMDKDEFEKVKNLDLIKLKEHYLNHQDEDGDIWLPECLGIKIYCLGKLYFCDTLDQLKPFINNIFSRECVNQQYIDYTLQYFESEKGFLKIIDIYKETILSHYKNLKDSNSLAVLKDKMKTNYLNWNHMTLSTDKNENSLTNSSHYECAIFNLLHEYKKIDFDKQIVLFIGY